MDIYDNQRNYRQDQDDDDKGEYWDPNWKISKRWMLWMMGVGSFPDEPPPPAEEGEECTLEQYGERTIRATIISTASGKIMAKIVYNGILGKTYETEANLEGSPILHADPPAETGSENEEDETPRVRADNPGECPSDQISCIGEDVAPLDIVSETTADPSESTSILRVRSVEVLIPPRDGSGSRRGASSDAVSTPSPLSGDGGMPPPRRRAKRARGKPAALKVSGAPLVTEGGGEALASPVAETEGEVVSPPQKRSGGVLPPELRDRIVAEARVFHEENAAAVISAAYRWVDGVDRVRRENPTLQTIDGDGGRLRVDSHLIREAISYLSVRLTTEESKSSGLEREEESLRAQVVTLEEKVRQLQQGLDKANSALAYLRNRSAPPGSPGMSGEVEEENMGVAESGLDLEWDLEWPTTKEDTAGWSDPSLPPHRDRLVGREDDAAREDRERETGVAPVRRTASLDMALEMMCGIPDVLKVLSDRMTALEASVASGAAAKDTRPRRRRSPGKPTMESSAARGKGRESEDNLTYASMAARPPPRTVSRDGGAAESKKKKTSTAPPPTAPKTGAPGSVMGGGRRRGNAGTRREGDGAGKGAEAPQARIRLPTSAAVLIVAEDRGMYKDLLSEARSSISVEELGVSAIRSRRSQAGDILLEIPGEGSGAAADRLAGRLRRLFEGRSGVQVVRPRPKLDLWISGCGVHTAPTAVAASVAAAGGCAEEEVRVTPAGVTRRGRMAFWASCPAASARKVAEGGVVGLGWERARAEISRGRPLRCYRCLAGGHTQQRCPSRIDRARCCFRCGGEGHDWHGCTRETHCPVCEARKLPADHRTGAAVCPPVPPGPFRRATTTVTAGSPGDVDDVPADRVVAPPPPEDVEQVSGPPGSSDFDPGAIMETEETPTMEDEEERPPPLVPEREEEKDDGDPGPLVEDRPGCAPHRPQGQGPQSIRRSSPPLPQKARRGRRR